MRSIEVLVDKHGLFIEQALRVRLFKEGTYSDGSKIKTFSAIGSYVYSPATINIKSEKGQPTDRVTLEDTGELYESFNTNAGSSSFLIEYDDDKDDGQVSDNIPDIEEAIQLGEEGLGELKELIKQDLRDDFEKEAREAILLGLG